MYRFSFLPALFGINQPPLHFLEIGGVEFSKGVAGAFPFSWSIGILVVGTFLLHMDLFYFFKCLLI